MDIGKHFNPIIPFPVTTKLLTFTVICRPLVFMATVELEKGWKEIAKRDKLNSTKL